jgi:hypothetical protein
MDFLHRLQDSQFSRDLQVKNADFPRNPPLLRSEFSRKYNILPVVVVFWVTFSPMGIILIRAGPAMSTV